MLNCCKHCGALLEDEVNVCPFCGKTLEAPRAEPAPQEQPAEVPVAVAEEVTETAPQHPLKKLTPKHLLIGGGIALAVIIAIVAVSLIFFSPNAAVSTLEAIVNGNFERYEALAPAEYWEARAKTNNQTVEEFLDYQIRFLEQETEQFKDAQPDIRGEPVSKTFHLVDSAPVSKQDLEGVRSAIEEEWGISADRVKDVRFITVRYEKKWTNYSKNATFSCYTVQIDSQWYLISCSVRTNATEFKYSVNLILSDLYALVLW